MKENSTSKTAFVLAGGGSLGAVQVGMLKALVSRGIRPDLIVGASVGAINGAYFAAAPDSEGVRKLEAIWTGLLSQNVFRFSTLKGLLRLFLHHDYLMDQSAIQRLIELNLPYQSLEEASVPCHVVATDIIDGHEFVFSEGPATTALLASTAIPAIFPPVVVGNHFLVDGGVANNTPISTAIDLGATRVIVLPTGFDCVLVNQPHGAIAIALQAMNLITARQLVLDMERLAGKAELIAVPPPCPMTVSPFDLSQSAALIERAAAVTDCWLNEGGMKRGGVPASLCPHAHGLT